jgi:hypothetical protein
MPPSREANQAPMVPPGCFRSASPDAHRRIVEVTRYLNERRKDQG